MKKIAVITTSKELKEFQERTDIRILDINVKACDQTWGTQEYFVATIVYDDDLRSEPDYWTCLEHQATIGAMQGILGNQTYTRHLLETSTSAKDARDIIVDASYYLAHALVEKMKEERK